MASSTAPAATAGRAGCTPAGPAARSSVRDAVSVAASAELESSRRDGARAVRRRCAHTYWWTATAISVDSPEGRSTNPWSRWLLDDATGSHLVTDSATIDAAR